MLATGHRATRQVINLVKFYNRNNASNLLNLFIMLLMVSITLFTVQRCNADKTSLCWRRVDASTS